MSSGVSIAAAALVALQCGLPLASVAAAAAPITPGDSPYAEAKRLAYGPTEDGRVRSCPTNINPNCVSTGSTNDAYSPAWFAPQSTPSAAADDLERAVLASVEGSELLQQVTLASGAEYRAFSAPSLFGQDVLEFVIKPEQPSGQLVTYRSMAGSVKYIWPIQQPIGDFDAQRKRLGQIKSNLRGWRALGCELIECYQ